MGRDAELRPSEDGLIHGSPAGMIQKEDADRPMQIGDIGSIHGSSTDVGLVAPPKRPLFQDPGTAQGPLATRRRTAETFPGSVGREDGARTPMVPGGIFAGFRKVTEEREADGNCEGLRNLQGPPAPAALRSYFLQVAEALRVEASGDAPELEDDEEKLLAESTYLIRDAKFPGYKMRLEHRMVIFLIFDGENWRSHSLQAYHYSDG